jgi:calcineurin-like phosphoesterase
MANLYVTITEEITLPNTTREKTNIFKTISNVNQILRRVDTIATTFSGSGIEILRFCNSEEEQSGGAFVKSDVQYVRITNLSTTYDTSLYLYANNAEIAVFNLNPGKTIMLGDADMNSFSMSDYVDPTYVDISYFSSYEYINSIKAKAISGSVQLEYFVAST